jgi:hypothetical protein
VALSFGTTLAGQNKWPPEHWVREFGRTFGIEHRHRRNASVRPIFGSLFSSSKAPVISFTVALDATDPCETNSERAPT